VIVLLYGQGANGKSTFIETLRLALGEYMRPASEHLILWSGGGLPNTNALYERADVHGARLLTLSEMEEEGVLNMKVLRRLCGGDSDKGRAPYGFFEITQGKFKLLISTNHKPSLRRGGLDADWDRLRLIPCEQRFVDPDRDDGRDTRGVVRDESFRTRLEQEAPPAVLAWIVAGAMAWRTNGNRLGTCRAIAEATDEWRAGVQPAARRLAQEQRKQVERWIDEECETGPNLEDLFSTLRDKYVAWAKRRELRVMTETAFGIALNALGCQLHRTKAGRFRLGIRWRI
jgi:phage/plasmid-associated DNA primase